MRVGRQACRHILIDEYPCSHKVQGDRSSCSLRVHYTGQEPDARWTSCAAIGARLPLADTLNQVLMSAQQTAGGFTIQLGVHVHGSFSVMRNP